MNINPNENPALETSLKLFESGVGLAEIRHSLEAGNYSAEEIAEAISVLQKLRYERRRKRGLIVALIGTVLLLFGCIAAVVMHDNTAGFRFALYAPSIIGCILVCWGLIDILGW